jgi:hypothetical protein
MNQRYDLLAISLLLFTVIFTVWLAVLPISSPSFDGIKENIRGWQPLIGGTITGVGVLVAAWNVTRQMRSAARGREQDRLSKELPGLRAALTLVNRFLPDMSQRDTWSSPLDQHNFTFEQLELIGAVMNKLSAPALQASIEKAIPFAPDVTKIELGMRLFEFCEASEHLWDMSHAHKMDLPDVEHRRVLAQERFERAIDELLRYQAALTDRITAEHRRSEILRREHDKFLGLKL